jgi:predicted nucleic acid-binding protein
MIYALDSNIISYVLKEDTSVINRYRQEAHQNNEFIIPPIVYFEIKRWLLENGAIKKQIEFDNMCRVIPIGGLDKNIWDIAAKLYVHSRQNGKPASDADIIIAAFCIANNYTLVTNNTRHFGDIDGLKLANWKE